MAQVKAQVEALAVKGPVEALARVPVKAPVTAQVAVLALAPVKAPESARLHLRNHGE